MRLFALLLLGSPVLAGGSLAARVNEAIDAGAAHLAAKQADDGSWGANDKVHPLARTALSTFTLLHAGYPRDHPAVAKALAFLRLEEVTPASTYEAGCLLLLMNALGPGYRGPIHRSCDWLLERFDGGTKLWGYPGGAPDLSNTQFAALGLKAGELNGFKVPRSVWRACVRGVLANQHASGAFRYNRDRLPRATMTHAGLLVLLFATESLGKTGPDVRAAMERGHDWYRKNFRVDRVPWGNGWHNSHYYYYMYGLERYAQLFGFEEIGGRDWYREGAEELLLRQKKDGSWGNPEECCFAILFLRRVTFTAPKEREPGGAAGERKDPPEPPKPGPKLPCVREWLLAGPYRSTPREDGMLLEEHFKPGRARPAPGARAGTHRWSVFRSETDMLDFKEAVAAADWCSFYAAVYLHAPEETEAVLWIGTDDGFRLFLNGRPVFVGHHHDYSGDDHYRIPLPLDAGRNTLIVQVENVGYDCKMKARIEGDTVVSVRRKPN